MMRKMKRIYNNKNALSYPMEAAISLTVIIFIVGIIVASISPSLEQSAVQKTIDLKAQALEISSLLKLSGETQTGSPKWQVDVAIVKDIGLGLDPDEITDDITSLFVASKDISDKVPTSNCSNNTSPNAPDQPVGETEATTGISYLYTAVATDPDGDMIQYRFDWGDGAGLSGWTNLVSSGTSGSKSHNWFSEGQYEVRVQARDYPCGDASLWSLPLVVNVIFDQPFVDDVDDDDSCFLMGTKITMADDSYKNIEQIVIGDKVKAYDEKTGMFVDSLVNQVFYHESDKMAEYYLIINNDLKVTPNHPIFSNYNWVFADNLQVGDVLIGRSGKGIIVYSIEQIFEQVPTYNLEVEQVHTYIANDVVVHNKPLLGNGTSVGSCPDGSFPIWCGGNPAGGYSAGYYCGGCPGNLGGVNAEAGSMQTTVLTQTTTGSTQTPNPAAGGTSGNAQTSSPGGSQAGTCFLSGSKIAMADGSYKNIEEIQVGDSIKSFDEQHQTIEVDEIEAVFHDSPDKMMTDYYLILNDEIKITPDHLLYVSGKWIPAGDLKIGDLFADKTYVTSMEKIFERVPTYNLETKIYHTFIVKINDDYIIAHNSGNYPVGGYDETSESQPGAKKTTENDPIPIFSIYKINGMRLVSPETMKKAFNLPDNIDVTIIITSLDGEETLLNYNTGNSPYDAKYVASYEETVLVWDAHYKASIYATCTVVVSSV